MSDKRYNLWGQFTPAEIEELRGRGKVQAGFPGLVAAQLGDVRTALAGMPDLPPEMIQQVDIILTNCRAAHENSAALWQLLSRAQFLSADNDRERLQ